MPQEIVNSKGQNIITVQDHLVSTEDFTGFVSYLKTKLEEKYTKSGLIKFFNKVQLLKVDQIYILETN